MMAFRKLLFVAVIQCVLIEIVRCHEPDITTPCAGLAFLKECQIDEVTKICLRARGSGNDESLRCIGELCDADQEVGADCSKPDGPTSTCEEICNDEDPATCKNICKKEKTGKDTGKDKGNGKGEGKGKGRGRGKGK